MDWAIGVPTSSKPWRVLIHEFALHLSLHSGQYSSYSMTAGWAQGWLFCEVDWEVALGSGLVICLLILLSHFKRRYLDSKEEATASLHHHFLFPYLFWIQGGGGLAEVMSATLPAKGIQCTTLDFGWSSGWLWSRSSSTTRQKKSCWLGSFLLCYLRYGALVPPLFYLPHLMVA